MSIRFIQPWNGYQVDQVATLSNEAALIAGGLARDSAEVDGPFYGGGNIVEWNATGTALLGVDGKPIPLAASGWSTGLTPSGYDQTSEIQQYLNDVGGMLGADFGIGDFIISDQIVVEPRVASVESVTANSVAYGMRMKGWGAGRTIFRDVRADQTQPVFLFSTASPTLNFTAQNTAVGNFSLIRCGTDGTPAAYNTLTGSGVEFRKVSAGSFTAPNVSQFHDVQISGYSYGASFDDCTMMRLSRVVMPDVGIGIRYGYNMDGFVVEDSYFGWGFPNGDMYQDRIGIQSGFISPYQVFANTTGGGDGIMFQRVYGRNIGVLFDFYGDATQTNGQETIIINEPYIERVAQLVRVRGVINPIIHMRAPKLSKPGANATENNNATVDARTGRVLHYIDFVDAKASPTLHLTSLQDVTSKPPATELIGIGGAAIVHLHDLHTAPSVSGDAHVRSYKAGYKGVMKLPNSGASADVWIGADKDSLGAIFHAHPCAKSHGSNRVYRTYSNISQGYIALDKSKYDTYLVNAQTSNLAIDLCPPGTLHSGTFAAVGANTVTLASDASATDDAYNGMVVYCPGGTGSGDYFTITDYVGATKVATLSANVSVWATAPIAGTAYIVRDMETATAQGGDATHITLAATASNADDAYNGLTIAIVAGTGAGQKQAVTDYVGSTNIATVASWATPPDATSVYVVISTNCGLGIGDRLTLMIKCGAAMPTISLRSAGTGYARVSSETLTATPGANNYRTLFEFELINDTNGGDGTWKQVNPANVWIA